MRLNFGKPWLLLNQNTQRLPKLIVTVLVRLKIFLVYQSYSLTMRETKIVPQIIVLLLRTWLSAQQKNLAVSKNTNFIQLKIFDGHQWSKEWNT